MFMFNSDLLVSQSDNDERSAGEMMADPEQVISELSGMLQETGAI